MAIAILSLSALPVRVLAVPLQAEPAPYDVGSSELAGRPGTLIRVQPFAQAPRGAAAAYRVLYRSVGLKGEPIAVSGVIFVPRGISPAGGRPIVAWGHSTTGIARSCALSLQPELMKGVIGLQDMLARGFVVAMTDYPGLGTAGPHPYLIGSSEGRAMLDVARAARNLREAGAGTKIVLSGFSQGGHASLFAATLAPRYAPELDVVGVAATAPPTELRALFRESGHSPIGRVFVTLALSSWSKLYNIPLHEVLDPRVDRVANNIASRCSFKLADDLTLMFAEQAYEREGFLKKNASVSGPWRSLIEENSVGLLPRGIPVFIAQGTSDPIIEPRLTRQYADRLCRNGSSLQFMSIKGAGHSDAGLLAGSQTVAWIADRFAGKPPPNECRARPTS